MIKAKVAFLEGRFFSSQSGLYEKVSDCSDWLDKSRSSKKGTFSLIMLTGYLIPKNDITERKLGYCNNQLNC